MMDSYLLMTDSYMYHGGLVEIDESANMINESAMSKNESTIFGNESATLIYESVTKYVLDFFLCAGFVLFDDGFINMAWRTRQK
jgi:hypothetical protein